MLGLYGFLAIRRLSGTGFDLRLRWTDWKTGLRELVYFAPWCIVLGLALGFLHPHCNLPAVGKAAPPWAGIFLFVAVPEELFFRAWVQNLLERRVGRRAALLIASFLFGLSHFNKRSAHFNWRYVMLATIAGIFYGRAWRENRRVPASSDHAHLRRLVVVLVVLTNALRTNRRAAARHISRKPEVGGRKPEARSLYASSSGVASSRLRV